VERGAEQLFGPLALRLAPRALVRERGPHEPEDGTVRVAWRGADGAEAILVERPDALGERAESDAGAACALAAWRAATAAPGAPRIMGVLNATPDSFSDGGLHLDPERAVARGLAMLADGADLLDVGGESTRPGAAPVDAAEERARVVPVLAQLRAATDAPLSIDTTKAEVAAAALDAGATMVNDVSAGRLDPEMLALVAARGCDYVLMHMQGEPRTMQRDPRYDDVVSEVCEHLRERAAACLQAGIAASRILADPGIGFGKRLEHNLALLRRLPELRSLGLPLLVGVSRKSFLGELTGEEQASRRLGSTAAAVATCVRGGAEILRVHDVKTMRDVSRVAAALRGGYGA
jgi:dihydropteroate synthase